jgi:hypothetical protein
MLLDKVVYILLSVGILNFCFLSLYYLHRYMTDKFWSYHSTNGEWTFDRLETAIVFVILFFLKYRLNRKTKWIHLLNIFSLLLLLYLLSKSRLYISIFNFLQDETYPNREGLEVVVYFMEYFGLLLIYILLAYQIVATILSFISGKPKLDNYRLNGDN